MTDTNTFDDFDHFKQCLTLEEYVEEKIKILEDFCIEPTDKELLYLYSLKSEIAIDAAVRKLIKKGLNAYYGKRGNYN